MSDDNVHDLNDADAAAYSAKHDYDLESPVPAAVPAPRPGAENVGFCSGAVRGASELEKHAAGKPRKISETKLTKPKK